MCLLLPVNLLMLSWVILLFNQFPMYDSCIILLDIVIILLISKYWNKKERKESNTEHLYKICICEKLLSEEKQNLRALVTKSSHKFAMLLWHKFICVCLGWCMVITILQFITSCFLCIRYHFSFRIYIHVQLYIIYYHWTLLMVSYSSISFRWWCLMYVLCLDSKSFIMNSDFK